jgi:hypothetical protein
MDQYFKSAISIVLSVFFLLNESMVFPAHAQKTNKLSIQGSLIYMNGQPFDMWGIRVASATEDEYAMNHLIAQLDDYKRHGVNSLAVFFMGSLGGAYDPFTSNGKRIDRQHRRRMETIIKEADRRGMVVVVGIFYQRVPQERINLKDWAAAENAVRTVARWTKKLPNKNIILNIANEQNSNYYEKMPWRKIRESESVIDLCRIAKQTNPSLIVGAGGYDIEKNKAIGMSEWLDILLFDTIIPEENSEFHYHQYKSAGINLPMVNVEMFGGWTGRFVDGVFLTNPDIRHYLKEVDGAARINGLYTFFFAADWSQSRAAGKANRYDLAGMGTPEDPGIRWFFEHLDSVRVKKEPEKPGLLVLTDIGGDPDDIQSLRRLLVYANEFHLEGFVATSTRGGQEIRRPGKLYVFENLIHDAINDYEKVRDNLSLHAEGYPLAVDLRKLVHEGQPNVGVENLSPGQGTPGSQHIIHAVDASDKILNIAIWGGAHDLAQALLDVKSTRTPKYLDDFLSKIRVYAIADQDKKPGVEKGTGEWIRENFPNLWYLESGPPYRLVFSASFRGMYQNESAGGDHPVLPLTKPGMELLNNEEWVVANVTSWGPLGEGYPASLNQNPNTPRNTRGVKEGDTPSWFYFYLNGLNNPDHPEWGGWGGRFEHITGGHFIDTGDNHWSGEMDGSLRRKWAVARWREAFQNDFAARMRWCKLKPEEANHNPIAVVDNDYSKEVLVRKVKQGQTVTLDATESHDPNGNKLSFNWWIYSEPSSSSGILLENNKPIVSIKIPESSPDGNVHVILEVKDDGSPNLYSYRRVILQVGEHVKNISLK